MKKEDFFPTPTVTDTLEVQYAPLAIIKLSQRFLVQITNPIAFSADIIEIPMSDGRKLEDVMLSNWKQMITLVDEQDENLGWLHNINKVKLIECDLLIEK